MATTESLTSKERRMIRKAMKNDKGMVDGGWYLLTFVVDEHINCAFAVYNRLYPDGTVKWCSMAMYYKLRNDEIFSEYFGMNTRVSRFDYKITPYFIN